MGSAEAWQPGELSGRPGLWSWRGTWRPFGPSLGSSVPSSRIADGSGRATSGNSVNRTSGSASSWPRWDGPDPGVPGQGGADTWVLVGVGALGLVLRLGPAEGSTASPHLQASQTEQELQRELDGLRGQCQAQALAGAELRTRLECLQGEVSASWVY